MRRIERSIFIFFETRQLIIVVPGWGSPIIDVRNLKFFLIVWYLQTFVVTFCKSLPHSWKESNRDCWKRYVGWSAPECQTFFYIVSIESYNRWLNWEDFPLQIVRPIQEERETWMKLNWLKIKTLVNQTTCHTHNSSAISTWIFHLFNFFLFLFFLWSFLLQVIIIIGFVVNGMEKKTRDWKREEKKNLQFEWQFAQRHPFIKSAYEAKYAHKKHSTKICDWIFY